MSPTGLFGSLEPDIWTPEGDMDYDPSTPETHMVLIPGSPYPPDEEEQGIPNLVTATPEDVPDGPLPTTTPEQRAERVPERQPRTTNELYAVLGEKGRSSVNGGGIVRLPEPIGNQTEIRCHVRLAPVFQRFLDELALAGLWHLVKRIDGFQLSKRRGTSGGAINTVSLRSWGAAIDINAPYNQYGHVLPVIPTGEPVELVAAGEPGWRFYSEHPIVNIARRCGLTWAGCSRWAVEGEPLNRLPDGATFQFMRIW